MKYCVYIVFYLFSSLVCEAQVDSLVSNFKECKGYLLKDSISLFDNLRNFTVKLPENWNGKLEGDLNTLQINKKPYSSIFKLIGSSSYDSNADGIETEKKAPNLVGIVTIESQEVVILKHPNGMLKEKTLHKYTFHFETKNNPWVWMFYLVADRFPTREDICEIKYIINQYIHGLKK